MSDAPCRLYLITPPRIDDLPAFAGRLEQALSGGDVAALQIRLKDRPDAEVVEAVRTLAPIMPRKMLNAAVNFYSHVGEGGPPEEQKKAAEERRRTRGVPYLFLKPTEGAIVGNGDNVVIPFGRDRMDWEVELGIVIGRAAKYVPATKAPDHIFGYMVTVDISDRGGRPPDSRPGSDWFVGKGHDVRAMSRSEKSDAIINALHATPVRCDLESVTPASIGNAEAVVHCAAFVEQWGPKDAWKRFNVDGTARMLAASKAAGDIEIVNVTSQASPLAAVPDAARVPDHFLVIEYRLGLQREHLVNPKVGIIVLARARVRDANGSQPLHQAIWAYCGERYHFVQMAANNGAALRSQIDRAAAVLAEAIPHDLYVSKRPRHLLFNSTCMDFSDLPSGIGRPVVSPRS